MAKDALSSLAGNRMGQLKSEIADLKAQLRKEFEPDKIAEAYQRKRNLLQYTC